MEPVPGALDQVACRALLRELEKWGQPLRADRAHAVCSQPALPLDGLILP